MGSCITQSKAKLRKEQLESLFDTTWLKKSGCIDKFTFQNSVERTRYQSLQLLTAKYTNSIVFNIESEEVLGYNLELVTRHISVLKKGIPNSSMSEFLFNLFNIKQSRYPIDKLQQFEYHDLEEISKVDEIYFGRSRFSTNMLNTKGISSMKLLMKNIKEEFPIIQYCPMLLRVVQMFLWFVPPKVAQQMTILLIEEHFKQENGEKKEISNTKFFSMNLKYSKFLINIAGKVAKAELKNSKVIIEEIIDNLCIGVVPSEYLPVIFVRYLLMGVTFIANLAGNLFALVSHLKGAKLEDLQNACKTADIYEIIMNSNKDSESSISQLKSSESALSDVCSSYIPMMDKPSRVFNTVERKSLLFGLIPKVHHYGKMLKVFCFDQHGLLITDLYKMWKKESLASLILISSISHTVGVFFDRDLKFIEEGVSKSFSLIFFYEKNINVFKHQENKELLFEFTAKKGITIGSKEKPAVIIDYSLLDATIFATETFISFTSDLTDEIFQINNIELFLMR